MQHKFQMNPALVPMHIYVKYEGSTEAGEAIIENKKNDCYFKKKTGLIGLIYAVNIY